MLSHDAHPTRRIRPTLEALEERIVPTNFGYGGGPLIQHVQVNDINMGPQPLDTTALMASLTRDYLPLLTPYYNVGAGVVHFAITIPPLPGNPNDGQIMNTIVQEINAGAVAPPDGNQLYFVFLAPGQDASSGIGAEAGYHSSFPVYRDATGWHIGGFPQPGTVAATVFYAVSFGNSADQVTQTASHELAEAVTDPTFTGYVNHDAFSIADSEVADIYEFAPPFVLDGYEVAMLSGPVGQKIFIPPPATLANLETLALQVAEDMAVHLIASVFPQYANYAQIADAVLNSNLLYGTPQGQPAVQLGQQLYANWVSQLEGG